MLNIVEPVGMSDATLHVCPKCEAEFAPKRSNQKYCSGACRKNGTRGSREHENRQANERRSRRHLALQDMLYGVPPSERLGMMRHILSCVTVDANLSRILTKQELLRERPGENDDINRGRKNIAQAANAYTSKFHGVSITTFLAQSREGTLREDHPVTREVDHGSAPRLKPMRKAKCWHSPVAAKDQIGAARQEHLADLARDMAADAAERAQSMVNAHMIDASAA